jgi:hypothetical protein
MEGVTNRIPFEEAADLLASARACVAVVVDGAPHVEPAVVRYREGRFLVGVDRSAPVEGAQEATLVVDEGVRFFDLRAVYVRGTPTPIGAEDHDDDDVRLWFEIEPSTVTCWDYGRLRSDGVA